MDVKFGPNSHDEPHLLYKLQRKIKVFSTANPLPNRGYDLVTSSSKYGLVFIGSPDGILSVYHLKDLVDKENEALHTNLKIPENPTHIAISCDQELLAITGGQLLCVYRVSDFQDQNVASKSMYIKLGANPSTFVSALQWNPCIVDTIAIAFFDGTLLVGQVTNPEMKRAQSKARCICWSPKGKQLVTGNSDGTLSQYKPDLTLAKNIPAPNIFEGAPVEALAIYWISTFQFAVVFKNASDNSRPAVTIVNTPKAGQPTCINYEDICYSIGSSRPWYYYLQGIPQWNLILSSSSNSMEIASLGSTDGANWLQWCQSDEARPELPLTDKKQENYPVGICIDVSAVHQLPWGENDTLPHMPQLLVVSQTGVLTVFNIINLNKDAPQLCTPPQPFALPATAVTSEIPGETSPPLPQAATPAFSQPAVPQSMAPQPMAPLSMAPQPMAPQPAMPQSMPQPVASQLVVPQPVMPQSVAPPAAAKQLQPSQATSMFGTSSSKFATSQPQTFGQSFAAAPVQPKAEHKPSQLEMKSTPAPTPQPQNSLPAQKPASQPISAQTSESNAALRAEQEKANKLKADQELRNMLVKEVNDFQMELYKFVVKSRQMQAQLQKSIDSINCNFGVQSMDTEQLKRECSLDELRSAVVTLKLELVRACAVVAEARTHAEAKDVQQWTQTDPLTIKRVESVKKLAYYVQSQLDQALKALDFKWNEMITSDPQLNKPGQRMIRPILDDVYQPLVKQQEILSRQQAVLRTLRNTLKECDATPMFKSPSLLRSTPFRNKDPLSKLTKNILNMSLDTDTNKPKDNFLSAQKLDALRDMLSNHKPVKIKPVNVEIRQQLAAIRRNYEKSVTSPVTSPEVKAGPVKVKSEPVPFMSQPASLVQPVAIPHKPEMKYQPAINVPSFTPVNNAKASNPGLNSVSRALFTDEPKQEQKQIPKAQPQPIKPQPSQPAFPSFTGFGPPSNSTVSENTRSMLKDMLQNKQTAQASDPNNMFMGQKICSPLAYSSPTPMPTQQPAPPSASLSKPIAEKFTPQSFAPDAKLQTSVDKTKKEADATKIEGKVELNKAETPMTNLFGLKPSAPLSTSASNVPDVLKTSTPISEITIPAPKPREKVVEKSKENVPEKSTEISNKKTDDDKKENIARPIAKAAVKLTDPSSASPIVSGPKTVTPELPVLSPTSSAASIFAAANASTSPTVQSVFGTSTSTPSSQSSTPGSPNSPSTPATVEKPETKSPTSTNTSSASLLFGSAASKAFSENNQENTTTSSKEQVSAPSTGTTATSDSIFKSSSTPPAVSDSSKPTVFSTATPASPSSIFGAAASAAITTTTATTTTATSSDFLNGPMFANPTTSAFGSGSIFTGRPNIPVPETPTSTVSSTVAPTSVFGSTASTPASVFGTATTTTTTTTAGFSAPPVTTSASVFGSPTTTAQSLFGTPSTTTDTVFGSPATTTASVFGTPSTTTAAVFGSPVATTASSAFGAPATTTVASVFGSPSAASVFGGAATQNLFGATSPSSVFGSATTTTQSVFGTTTATTQASIFGSPSAQPSVFGSATPTTQSIFGASTQSTAFGTPTSTPSVFGSPSAAQGSVFGSPQQSQASVFGSPKPSAGSIFGETNNLFAAASISTSNASSPGSGGGSIFGGGSSGSVFGASTTNVFGGKTTFGQNNAAAASIFGGGGAGGGAAFGQKPATDFWSGGSGSGAGGFQSSVFGQPATTQASIFGGGGSFSSPSGGQPFGSPQQTVFGSPQQQQSGTAFGGSPVFGSKPAFGQSASFGGPAFGGTSPGKAFGGGAASPGFGSPTQSNATFESLATQNTLTFGNLAQQSQAPAPAAPAFNNNPSFTGWRS